MAIDFPTETLFSNLIQAQVAQSVEHQAFNLRVAGSSPSLGAIFTLNNLIGSRIFITLVSLLFLTCEWRINIKYFGEFDNYLPPVNIARWTVKGIPVC